MSSFRTTIDLSVGNIFAPSMPPIDGQVHCSRYRRRESLISPTAWSRTHQAGPILLTRNLAGVLDGASW